jgi:DNA-binding PadR family transcriptional regulator
MSHRTLLTGLIRLYILIKAKEQEIFGKEIYMMLDKSGLPINTSKLYSVLHAMEREGYLISRKERRGNSLLRLYRITAFGREGLTASHKLLKNITKINDQS